MNTDLGGRISDLGVRIDALDAKVDRFRVELMGRMDEGESRRIDELDSRLTGRIDELDAKLDQTMSRHFLWLAGFQFTVLVAVIAALVGP